MWRGTLAYSNANSRNILIDCIVKIGKVDEKNSFATTTSILLRRVAAGSRCARTIEHNRKIEAARPRHDQRSLMVVHWD